MHSAERLMVVTGASSGIGLAVAAHLVELGGHVLGLSRSTGPLGDHPRFTHISCDLASVSDVSGAAERAVATGAVNTIVHAAGVQFSNRVGDLDASASERMWRVHVLAAEQLVNALAPTMAEHGRIVLIGSRTAVGVPAKSQYGATKAALLSMARSWAAELAPRGITVNVVAPGPTDTPMLKDPNRSATPVLSPPLGRLVRPDEVAAVVGFLVQESGAMITGQQVVICGGTSLG